MRISSQDQHKHLTWLQKLKKQEQKKLLLYQKKLYVLPGIFMILPKKKILISLIKSKRI